MHAYALDPTTKCHAPGQAPGHTGGVESLSIRSSGCRAAPAAQRADRTPAQEESSILPWMASIRKLKTVYNYPTRVGRRLNLPEQLKKADWTVHSSVAPRTNN